MKKTVYGIFAALTLVFAFAACDDDSSDIDRGTHAQLPEQAIAGSYTGIYTIIKNDRVTVEGTADATITFTPVDSVAYTVIFESACATKSDLDGKEENAFNVTWANDDIKFWGTTSAGSTFKASALNGTCTADGTLTFKFSKSVRTGMDVVIKYYSFTGTRNQ